MKLCVALAQAIGKLQWSEQDRTGPGKSVRKQIPLERLIVIPHGMVVVPEKTLVVLNDVGDHQPDEAEDEIFWANTRRSANLDGRSCQGDPSMRRSLRRGAPPQARLQYHKNVAETKKNSSARLLEFDG